MAEDRERFDGPWEEDEDFSSYPTGEDSVQPSEEVLYRPDSTSSTRLTVDEAAQELGMDHGMVEDMIRDGFLESTPGGGETVVDIQDLRQFQEDLTEGMLRRGGSREVPEPLLPPVDGGDPGQAIS